MGFCTDEEYDEFIRLPEVERMLIHSGITLLKYWFSVSDDEQERRFKEHAGDPARRWKLSPMDLQSMSKWVEYSRGKDEMFRQTDTKKSPWWTVEANNQRRARLNCIAHILSCVPYKDATPPPLNLPNSISTNRLPPPANRSSVWSLILKLGATMRDAGAQFFGPVATIPLARLTDHWCGGVRRDATLYASRLP